MRSLLSGFKRRAALPAPEPAAVPNDPLSVEFRAAAYGRKFATQNYTKPLLQTGDVESLRAVALSPDQWRIVKVTRQHQVFGGEEVRVLEEGTSFIRAAEKLLAYELTAATLGLVPLEGESRVLGFDHVLDFCLREGLVPDAEGKLHPLVEGEILTPGQFKSAHIEKAKQFSNQDPQAAAGLPDQWHRTFLEDLFGPHDPCHGWAEIGTDLKHLESINFFIFHLKSCCHLIDLLNANGHREKEIDLEAFVNDTMYIGRRWKPKALKEWLSDDNICGSMIVHMLEQLERSPLPENLKGELQYFARDFYTFDLTRRIKFQLAQGGEAVKPAIRHNIDSWVARIKDNMAANGHTPDMIRRAEAAAMNPSVQFDTIPPEIRTRVEDIEKMYFAMQNNLDRKLQLKPSPQLPLSLS